MSKIFYFSIFIVVMFFAGVQLVNMNSSKDTKFSSVNSAEFSKKINNSDVVVLDVRTPEEYNSGKISNAVNIDIYTSDFKDRLNNLDKNKNYAVYCRSGNRSSQAALLMKELGFKNVTELQGGIQSWVQSGYQIEK